MKQRLLSTLLSAAMVAGLAFNADAKPAKRGVLTVTQPDGTEINVRLTGDERFHYYTTEDGYLLSEQDGLLYYSKRDAKGAIVNSGIRATNAAERTAQAQQLLAGIDSESMVTEFVADREARMANGPRYAQGPGLFPGTSFPAQGVQKGLVILVRYTDVDFTSSYYTAFDGPGDYFEQMLNKEGWNKHGGTGSARDWFIECSAGNFLPDFDVYGPVTLSHNMAYYGGNDWWGNDQNPEQMAIEACQQLDATVDFSQYDRDNDGYIDNVYIFYAGRGEADGGSANTVWPHSWEVSSATSTPYYFDGVRLDRYACSNERDASKPDGIGTFCHEFSHVMGLPDEYSTRYTGAFTPGAWSPMDYGPYNNDGRTPPTYSAFNRYALGWIDPIVIDKRMNGRLEHIMSSNQAYIIPTGDVNEYFMLENRQKVGSDAYIPGHGMLIWHIDYDASVWSSNTPNNEDSHQHIDIEEADGTKSEYTRDGDPFPGVSHKTEFTSTTTPALKTWNNRGLEFPITEITEENGVITFKVLGGIVHVDPTEITEVSDVTTESFKIAWNAKDDATNYRVTLMARDTEIDAPAKAEGDDEVGEGQGDDEPQEPDPLEGFFVWRGMDGVDVGNVTEYTFSDLVYYYEYAAVVTVENSGSLSDPSAPVFVTPLFPTFDNLPVILEEPTEITGDSFVANWKQREDGATDYFITVYKKNIDEYYSDGYDFTAGISGMPEGWETNSNATYNNSAYAGAATPSLKLSADGSYVATRLYDEDIHEFGFWYRGASSTAGNTVEVLALVGGQWAQIDQFNVSNVAGGTMMFYPVLPDGARQIKVVYNKVGTGYVAIDDITVQWGGVVEIIPTQYTDLSVGGDGETLCDLTSFCVTGLESETRYFYTVQAFNGDLYSLKSAEGNVTTGKQTVGIASVNADPHTGILVNGRVAMVTAPAGTDITVADASGRVIAAFKAADMVTRVNLPAGGLYIIKAGSKAVKAIVK